MPGDMLDDTEVGSGAGSGGNISFLDELFSEVDELLTELDATEENTTVNNVNIEYAPLPSCEEFLIFFFIFISVYIVAMYLVAALAELYRYYRH